jgi:hypothetical protein
MKLILMIFITCLTLGIMVYAYEINDKILLIIGTIACTTNFLNVLDLLNI